MMGGWVLQLTLAKDLHELLRADLAVAVHVRLLDLSLEVGHLAVSSPHLRWRWRVLHPRGVCLGRPNAMRQYEPSSDISGYVGTTKGFTAQIKSTSSLPDCLSTCSAVVGPQASDVKDGHCYVNRHCYQEGDFAPYPGEHCRKCDPTTAAGRLEWSDPVTTSMCFIGGKCIEEGAHEQVMTGQGRYGPTYGDHPCSVCKPSVNGNGYTPIASGCMVSTRARRPTCDAHVPVAPVAHRPYAPVPSVRSWRWTCPSSKRLATTTKGA